MNKKTFLIIILVMLISLSPLMAKSSLAKKVDGTIVILNEDDKTYENFVEITYDVPTGFKINGGNNLNYMGIDWDKGALIALGNYVRGVYTTGEFYLLELEKSYDTATIRFDRAYPSPTLKLSDGTEIKGYYEDVRAHSVFSNYRNLLGVNQRKTLTYSLRFNVPKNVMPTSIVFRDINNQNPKEIKLGTKGKL